MKGVTFPSFTTFKSDRWWIQRVRWGPPCILIGIWP